MQFGPMFGDKQSNFRAVEELVSGCTADLLVLPELFATGYAFTSREEAMELSEETGAETAEFLSHLASHTDSAIVAGFAEREHDRVYNSAMMIGPSGLLSVYRKIHIFNREKLWFSAGDSAPEPVVFRNVSIGMMICFDCIFPETCRTLALKGAQIIAHPSNLVLPWAQKAMTTRCIENRVFAVTANRIGREQRGSDDFTFTGQSQVTGCMGEVLASAPPDKPSLQLVDINPAEALDKSVNPFNHLFDDRQTRFYSI